MRHSINKCWQLSLTRVSDDDVLEEVRVGHLPRLARWSAVLKTSNCQGHEGRGWTGKRISQTILSSGFVMKIQVVDDKGGSHINFTTSPHDGDDVELRDDDGERQLLRTSLTQKQKQMVKENWRFWEVAI